MSERQAAERDAWDRKAAERGIDLEQRAAIADEWSEIYDILLSTISDIADRRLIECGCGEGKLGSVAVDRGAKVVGFDLSGGQLAAAKAGDDRLSYVQAGFEQLPFPDASLDGAIGMFVLHHVDLPPAAAELARVMPTGAEAVFLETWARNPALRWARRLRGKAGVAKWGTDDERPLLPEDIDDLAAAGFEVTLSYPGLVLFRLLDNNVLKRRWARATKVIDAIDDGLSKIKAIKPFGYYVIIHLRRR